MTDARWLDVDADLQSAVTHYKEALEIRRAAALAPKDGFQTMLHNNAMMHSMQMAHTSAESALLKILDILGETPPTGENWHIDLLNRAGRAIPDGELARDAILPPDVLSDLQESRRFRHVATRSYDSFDPERAVPSLEAAERLVKAFEDAIRVFKESVDPEKPEQSDVVDEQFAPSRAPS